MALQVDQGFPTLANIMKALAPDGSVESEIANTFTKKCPMLRDIPWVEANQTTGDRVTSVNGLPAPSFRKANAGSPTTKVENVQYDEACGMIDDFSKIDVAVADMSGNAAKYRDEQDKVKQEAFTQTFENAILYESAITHPERIHGLTPRYPASTGYTSSGYVLPKGTLSGTNCESIWLINWSPDKICGIYPKGSKAGIQYEDLGKQLVTDSNNNSFTAWVSHYVWKLGLRVKDYRYAVRLQWDPDDSADATHPFHDTAKGLFLGLQDMLATVYDLQPTARIYMSRNSQKKLNNQLASNSNNFLKYVEEGGTFIPTFLGVPMRITDMLIPESAIS